MAENVQYHIENSLQELEQLKNVGLFSEGEIRKIAKKRKMLEYKVAKMFKRKEDYLKFIQYEIALLNLIRIRREKLRYFQKKAEIDTPIGKRINYLFKAAIRKFPNDMKLWFSHHDFLKKMHWVDSITTMNTYMLQIHNKSPELWVTCAKWELEDNNSIENARKLFQRGLRFHPTSELIWKEYFRLELLYVDQLLQRRKVLGIEETEDADDDSILQGQVAVVVYKNSIKSIEGVNLPLSFIAVCKDFEFSAHIVEMILADIGSRYPKMEEVLDALAKHCMNKTNDDKISSKRFLRTCIEDTIMKYEEAVCSVPTEKMWDFYIQFLLDRLSQSKSERKMRKMLQKVLEALEEASKAMLLSQKMYVEWIKLLYSKQELEKARQAAFLASTLFPEDPLIWHYCLMLHAEDQDAKFLELFHKAVSSVVGKASLPLWQTGIEWTTCGKVEHIQDIFEKGLLQGPEVQLPLKVQYLKLTAVLLGIAETRSLYDRLRMLAPLSAEFFETMVLAEKAQLRPDLKKIKKCYEDAIGFVGDTSPETWLNYMQVLEANPDGNPGQLGKVYWRALKHLKPELSDEFVKKHTLRFKANDSAVGQEEF